MSVRLRRYGKRTTAYSRVGFEGARWSSDDETFWKQVAGNLKLRRCVGRVYSVYEQVVHSVPVVRKLGIRFVSGPTTTLLILGLLDNTI